jgi:guanylate kinase
MEPHFDYVIINDDLNRAIEEAYKIIKDFLDKN